MATHSSVLAWRTPWIPQSMALQRVQHNRAQFTTTPPQPPPHLTHTKQRLPVHRQQPSDVDNFRYNWENAFCTCCFHLEMVICSETCRNFISSLVVVAGQIMKKGRKQMEKFGETELQAFYFSSIGYCSQLQISPWASP